MLRQRVITALVLLALLLAALFSSSAWPFAMLMLLGIGAAGLGDPVRDLVGHLARVLEDLQEYAHRSLLRP